MRLWGYVSTSMLTPNFSSTEMWLSQMVISLIQRRKIDSSKLSAVGTSASNRCSQRKLLAKFG